MEPARYQRIRNELGNDVVSQVEHAVRHAFLASRSKKSQQTGSLETLLVCMLASVIATYDRDVYSMDQAKYCADLLMKIVANLESYG